MLVVNAVNAHAFAAANTAPTVGQNAQPVVAGVALQALVGVHALTACVDTQLHNALSKL